MDWKNGSHFDMGNMCPTKEEIHKLQESNRIAQEARADRDLYMEREQQEAEEHAKALAERRLELKAEFEMSDFFRISPRDDFQDVPNVDVYNEPFARPIPDIDHLSTTTTILIRSAPGTGKTLQMEQHSRRHAHLRQMILSPRQMLAWYQTERTKRLGFKCYLEEQVQSAGDLGKQDKLIVGVLSIWKVDIGKPASKYDIIYIDEIEQMCSMLMNRLMTGSDHFREIATSLTWHLQNAIAVIGMDGALTRRSYEMLTSLRGGNPAPTTISINNRLPKKREVVRIDHRDKQTGKLDTEKIVRTIMCRLQRNPYTRVAFVTASAKLGKRVNEVALGFKIPTIIHVRDKKNREILQNVNEGWNEQNCRLLIISPTITTGVSYEGTPFDELVCYFSANIPVRDQMQMTLRFRELQSDLVSLFCCSHASSNNHGAAKTATIQEAARLTVLPQLETFQDIRSNLEASKRHLDTLNTKLQLASQRHSTNSELVKFFQAMVNAKTNEISIEESKLEFEFDFDWLCTQAKLNKLEELCNALHFESVLKEYQHVYHWKFIRKCHADDPCIKSSWSDEDTAIQSGIQQGVDLVYTQIETIDDTTAADFMRLQQLGQLNSEPQTASLMKWAFRRKINQEWLLDNNETRLAQFFDLLINVRDKEHAPIYWLLLRGPEWQPQPIQLMYDLNTKRLIALREIAAKLNVHDLTQPNGKRIRDQRLLTQFDTEECKHYKALFAIADCKSNHQIHNLLNVIFNRFLAMTLQKETPKGHYYTLKSLHPDVIDFGVYNMIQKIVAPPLIAPELDSES